MTIRRFIVVIGLILVLIMLIAAQVERVGPEPKCPAAELRADPDRDHGPGVRYCPDTGTFVAVIPGVRTTCPSLNVGGYLPGGLRPNQR